MGKVPAGVAACAYRIVQESLSNASQHAPGAAVTVWLERDARAVQLRVANGPGGTAARSGRERERGRGHGLTGMGGAGDAARRVAVCRADSGRRLRGDRGAPARRAGMSTAGTTTRCLIADDQAMVREGFAAVLSAEPGLQVVDLAADGADAVRLARHLEPDVVLMDVRMPVMDGLQATREILGAAGFGEGNWPREMSLTDNLRDLQRHARDFAERRGFTYTVLGTGTGTGEVIGCVYMYPPDGRGPDGGERRLHASAESWVRADHAALDPAVHDAVVAWLERDWPFDSIEYAPRTLSALPVRTRTDGSQRLRRTDFPAARELRSAAEPCGWARTRALVRLASRRPGWA
jgi:CheY-like chemotaxis protein